MKRIDDAVRRILRVKFRAGLFEHPYVDVADAPRQADAAREPRRRPRGRRPLDGAAQERRQRAAAQRRRRRPRVIGPLGDDGHDMLGPWWGRGDDDDAVSLFAGMKAQNPNATFTPGCTMSHNDLDDPAGECATDRRLRRGGRRRAGRRPGRARARRDARDERRGRGALEHRPARPPAGADRRDQGDRQAVRGRAVQRAAADAERRSTRTRRRSSRRGSPASRPATPSPTSLFGKVNPGGKLPVTFPRNVGQVPIYYNHEPTGRPCDATRSTTRATATSPSCAPLYEFGYGLSYTTFTVANLRLSSTTMNSRGSITATVDVTNTGTVAGDDVAQLYIHDPVASISQPVRRLRGFQRVTLKPGEKTTVSWTLDASDVGFYDNQGKFRVEPGAIEVYAGDSSSAATRRRSSRCAEQREVYIGRVARMPRRPSPQTAAAARRARARAGGVALRLRARQAGRARGRNALSDPDAAERARPARGRVGGRPAGRAAAAAPVPDHGRGRARRRGGRVARRPACASRRVLRAA